MDDQTAAKTKVQPLRIYRGIAVAGCELNEMGIRPIYAVPKLFKQPWFKDGRYRALGIELSFCGSSDLLS
ncbi:MAG: hypothetical protein ACI9TK_000533 [Flavobacteriaceae bacterium]|jgi:hypothetical protein|tara:strand:- start:2059 stop:2268 length:210 start_codon:yes stop_codon:yes gene_type:complete